MELKNQISEIESILKKSSLKKVSFPHLENQEGKPLDLEIEQLPDDQKVQFLSNYTKNIFAKDGVYFKDLVPEEQLLVKEYYQSLKKKFHLN